MSASPSPVALPSSCVGVDFQPPLPAHTAPSPRSLSEGQGCARGEEGTFLMDSDERRLEEILAHKSFQSPTVFSCHCHCRSRDLRGRPLELMPRRVSNWRSLCRPSTKANTVLL